MKVTQDSIRRKASMLRAALAAKEAELSKALEWRDAIDGELTTLMMTADSFETPREALLWLIGKEIEIALDPAVSKDARNLVAAKEAELAAERAKVEKLREALEPINVPADLIEQVLSMGRVEWGATAEKTAAEHIADFTETLRITREHFDYEDVPVKNHGVYLEGTETVLCHTGTSPNSGQNARVLVGLWNKLHDALAALATLAETQP